MSLIFKHTVEKTYEIIVRGKDVSTPLHSIHNTERMAQIIGCNDGRNTWKMG
jgi:hypothetical protein